MLITFSKSLNLDPSKIQPSVLVLRERDFGEFICYSNNYVVWTHNDGKFQKNVNIINTRLYIQNTVLSNRGYYECESKTKDNDIFYARAVLKIKGKLKYLY